MKEIKAIIRPFKLDDVITALYSVDGLPGITISKIHGFGKSKAKNSEDEIRDGLHAFVEKVKLELVVHNEIVDEVVDSIQRIAYTGNPGDGKIFVIEVSNTIKIRTNERGEKAI
ncbi:MAG: P-II family nitrogen regulator [Bacteroidetes bacterium]|nr:P-II family nitrogen regulator [Bacteroidota bacterium]MBU1115547.1 P-II family nitrogen regulator [Bacteroidota bacterium]MBU1797703.1 P-II family nitrogen regulator [Bacteroidota bacterium]